MALTEQDPPPGFTSREEYEKFLGIGRASSLAVVDLPPYAWVYPPPKKKSLLDGMTSEQRKEYPLTTGCLDYFRDALLYVSHVSFKGNQKHNPGEEIHWARGKSTDEPDAMARHLVNRDDLDGDLLEAGEMAWRACAYLQKLLETKYNIEPPRGCK